MDYNLFCLRLGKLDVPTPEQEQKFIYGDDSVHGTIAFGLGRLPGGGLYFPDIPDEDVNRLLEMLALIKSRGAKRGRDYVICCHGVEGIPDEWHVGVHTTSQFYSDEDK